MYEFEVELKTGKNHFLFGRDFKDAVRRDKKVTEQDIRRILHKEYVD